LVPTCTAIPRDISSRLNFLNWNQNWNPIRIESPARTRTLLSKYDSKERAKKAREGKKKRTRRDGSRRCFVFSCRLSFKCRIPLCFFFMKRIGKKFAREREKACAHFSPVEANNTCRRRFKEKQTLKGANADSRCYRRDEQIRR